MTLTLVHGLATWVMVGVIWFVQIVHYPLLARVGATQFAGYEAAHRLRTGAVVSVPWAVEGVAAVALVIVPSGPPRWMAISGLVALVVIVVSTVGWQVPAHERLTAGFDPSVHRRLVTTNWVRTVTWTLRGALAAAMIAAV